MRDSMVLTRPLLFFLMAQMGLGQERPWNFLRRRAQSQQEQPQQEQKQRHDRSFLAFWNDHGPTRVHTAEQHTGKDHLTPSSEFNPYRRHHHHIHHHAANKTSTTTITDEQKCYNNNNNDPKQQQCSLTSTDYGIPVVLITAGRSGSSALWQILSSLLSETTHSVREDVGHADEDILQFMQEHEADKDCWLARLLCQKQANSRHHSLEEPGGSAYPIFGTKWKPKTSSFHGVTAGAALDWLAQNPHIKVVFNLRNPLDAYISEIKHRTHHPPAHCAAGDEKCFAQHIKAEATTVLNTTDLLEKMAFNVAYGERAEQELVQHGVSYVKVFYEHLFYGNSVDEWLAMIDFIGAHSRFPNITRKTIRSVSQYEATSTPNQSSRVENSFRAMQDQSSY